MNPSTFDLTIIDMDGMAVVPLDDLLMLLVSMEVTAEAEAMPEVAAVFASLGTQIAGATT